MNYEPGVDVEDQACTKWYDWMIRSKRADKVGRVLARRLLVYTLGAGCKRYLAQVAQVARQHGQRS